MPLASWIGASLRSAFALRLCVGCVALRCTGTVYVVGLEGVPILLCELVAPAGRPGWLLVTPGPGIAVSRWISGEIAPCGEVLPVPKVLTLPLLLLVLPFELLPFELLPFELLPVLPVFPSVLFPLLPLVNVPFVVVPPAVFAGCGGVTPLPGAGWSGGCCAGPVPVGGALTPAPGGGASGGAPEFCADAAHATARMTMRRRLRRCIRVSLDQRTKGLDYCSVNRGCHRCTGYGGVGVGGQWLGKSGLLRGYPGAEVRNR